MKTKDPIQFTNPPQTTFLRGLQRCLAAARHIHPVRILCTLLLVATFSGCQQPASQLGNVGGASAAASPFTSTRLAEGDTVRVAFEGDTNMNTVVKVQLDGTIALPMIGAYKAVGLTPAELRTALMERYKTILSVNEITVSAISSPSVYVSGAVLKPGRIPLDRPLTALEAVMEAGGFDHRRAKVNTVTVIRKEEGQQRRFTLDLKRALREGDTTPFYVQPFDIIHVPEKSFNF
ncbi:MAG TPA: polysaccharide biosynthesis/export family protein [Verrucomicrobiae bacterium]